MAIDVQWDTALEQCILITYFTPWTWEEFDAAYAEMLELLNTLNKQVTLIIDIRQGGFPPSDALPRFRQVVETQHPSIKQIIFVAPGSLAHFVRISLSIIRRVYRTVKRANAPEFQFAASLEEARALSQSESTTAASS